jgi:NitT/TauT family transport system permease protein
MRSTDRSPLRRRLRRAALFALSLVLVAVGWELYKLIGPADGGSILGWKLLPRANDNAMPHISDMLSRYS